MEDESTLRQILMNFKTAFLGQNKQYETEAVMGIKQFLLLSHSQPKIVQLLIELDIHELLTKLLFSATYPVIKDVLECVHILCMSEFYMKFGEPVYTVESILKSLYFVIKRQNQADYVLCSLKSLQCTIERLNQYPKSKHIPFVQFLNIIFELLNTSNNIEIICTSATTFAIFLSYEMLIQKLTPSILNEIEVLWHLCIEKLSEICCTDKKSAFFALCKLCDYTLRFFKLLSRFENRNGAKFFICVLEKSVKCLDVICNPYVVNSYSRFDNVPTEYLCFLDIFLSIDQQYENLILFVCKKLIKEKNFNIIAKYIILDDLENNNGVKKFCLKLIAKIMVHLTSIEKNFWPYTNNKYHKYLLTELNVVSSDVNNWLSLIEQEYIKFDSKLCIIAFSCFYYIHADNSEELETKHLFHMATFINAVPYSVYLPETLMKDVWLLFAHLYCTFARNGVQNIYSVTQAVTILNRLLLLYIDAIENIVTYHPSVLYLICMVPEIKKKLKYKVLGLWLMKSQDSIKCQTALIPAIQKCKGTFKIFLQMAREEVPKYSLPATRLIMKALRNGFFSENPFINNEICSYMSLTIREITSTNLMREQVVNAIYLLRISSYVHNVNNIDVIRCYICSFLKFIETVGLSKKFPTIFYINAFQYTNGIICVAKNLQIQQVFITLLNSGSTMAVLLRAMKSDNKSICIESSKMVNHLLEYQSEYESLNQSNFKIDRNSLIIMLNNSEETQLILNLDILQKVFKILTKNTNLKIIYNIETKYIKTLFRRCVGLLLKPNLNSLSAHNFNCLITMLNYVQADPFITINYLWCDPSIFTLIYIYCDRDFEGSLNVSFLHFIQFWLSLSSQSSRSIFNKLSINHSRWILCLVCITEYIIQHINNSEYYGTLVKVINQLLYYGDLLPEDLYFVLSERVMIY